MSACRTIFVAGTDTGVGKTLVTAHLLYRLRRAGYRALAIKPFCSGGRGDIRLLRDLQDGELNEEQITPYFFSAAVAPFAALQGTRRDIRLSEVMRRITVLHDLCDVLLIEGSGGVMVPLGRGYLVRDLIAALRCEVLLVSRNKLGTINHTTLSLAALQAAGIPVMAIVLNGSARSDDSCETNPWVLRELIPSVSVVEVPYLGARANSVAAVQRNDKKIGKTLARLLGHDYCPPSSKTRKGTNKIVR